MMKQLENTLDICVKSLQSDPEVALDIRRELAGHLEERLAEGMSEEEALRHFGDPDEIGAGLFQANFARLKLRARIRLAVKILAVPLLIAAVLFSINFRFWGGAALLLENCGLELPPRLRKLCGVVARLGRSDSHLTPEERLIVYGDRSRKATANLSAKVHAQYAILELDPESRMFRANAISALLADDSMDNHSFRIAEVEKARSLEPENAFYDLLLASLLLDDALILPQFPDSPFQIRDRALLDRAMAIFRTGLSKPYLRSYVRELSWKWDSILERHPADFASGVERLVQHLQSQVPICSACYNLGAALPFYGELLQSEGKTAEGEFYLNAWKPFARRLLEEDATVDGYFSAVRVLFSQRSCARASIPESRKRELARACAPFEKYRELIRTGLAKPGIQENGPGFLSSLLHISSRLWSLDPARLEPERRLNYVFASGVMLQLLNLLGVIVLCGYAVGMLYSLLRGRPGFLLTFSRREVFRIVVLGILLPVALFFILMEWTPLGGRSWGVNIYATGAFLRLALEAFVFVFLLPLPFLILWGRACRRRGLELGFARLPAAVRRCNWFVGWVVLLVSFTVLIRPGLNCAERYWSDRELCWIHADHSTWGYDLFGWNYRRELLEALPK